MKNKNKDVRDILSVLLIALVLSGLGAFCFLEYLTPLWEGFLRDTLAPWIDGINIFGGDLDA